MAVKLSQVIDPPKQQRATILQQINSAAIYTAADLFRDTRAAVARECGSWGAKRERTNGRSDYERDALASEVFTLIYSDPEQWQAITSGSIDRPLRFTILRHRVRDLLRDSRGFLDTLDGWQTRPNLRECDADGIARRVKSTTAEATEYAAKRVAASATSLDKLEAIYSDPDNENRQRDFAQLAAIREHQERERIAGESLPPIAAAAHTADLAAAMLAEFTAEWKLTPRDRQRVRVALLIAAGEAIKTVSADQHLTADQTKKAAAKGRAIIASRAVDPAMLARTRRACAQSLGLALPDADPQTLARTRMEAAAEATVSAAVRAEQRVAGISGRGSLPCRPMPCTAADVLAYIGEAERRIALAEVHSIRTRVTRTRVTRTPSAAGLIRVWEPTGPASISTSYVPRQSSGIGSPADRYARLFWPDGMTAGDATYSGQHPAARRDAWTRTAEYEREADPTTLHGQRVSI